jgi:hypothetical protein
MAELCVGVCHRRSFVQAQLYYAARIASFQSFGLYVNMATVWPTPCLQLLSMFTPILGRIRPLRRVLSGYVGYFLTGSLMLVQDRLPLPDEAHVACVLVLAAATACFTCFTQGSLFPIASVFGCPSLIGALELGAASAGRHAPPPP